MAGFRKPEAPREQLTLWSVKLDDAMAADHPVRHLNYLLPREPFAETFREWARDYVLMADGLVVALHGGERRDSAAALAGGDENVVSMAPGAFSTHRRGVF